ncbi:pantetheine-phosphate adenylyltransferase [Pasteuria penetrans]|uniref:pantetheine-phosphate adenylyltransferase n=1 Tax=Pasteuria penetrans TaxID=86005 RepID=UPI000FBD61F6|nr:pantetheine-phosphate adenylyltransferase [Pasteuria penetrans]
MHIAIYPGSFDPITYGHLDIIMRGSRIFQKLIVAVSVNSAKEPLFSIPERLEMLTEAVKNWTSVQTDSFEGLLVDYVHRQNSRVILRGLRATSDFEYELQISSLNRQIGGTIETLFLMSDSQHSYISSGMVKEVAQYGAPLHALVPPHVGTALRSKFQQ